ncbi:hypothetical protein ISN44_As06g028870 [Arabidopsis suecica]|uniref:Uncharacterized protein n=1 Tax=Arabidopsis suecica TaxID=45249 RepID=A0A8T2CE94_ARASU|nr:hypothetical protein ISN44_As06g028870 [Arabidopsis suecica]
MAQYNLRDNNAHMVASYHFVPSSSLHTTQTITIYPSQELTSKVSNASMADFASVSFCQVLKQSFVSDSIRNSIKLSSIPIKILAQSRILFRSCRKRESISPP